MKLGTKTKAIAIDDLLLDVNNPRFVQHESNLVHEDQIADSDQQAKALKRMESFEINTIESSIKMDGWIDADRVFVRAHKKSKKYVVVEGNRRIAAIKSLLQKHAAGAAKHKLEKELLASLQAIECVDLTGATNAQIERILGLRHHGAIKQWDLLPSSMNIYQAYSSRNGSDYKLDTGIAKQVADIFSLDTPEVKAKLTAYRAYLGIYEYLPEGDKRSEIDLNSKFSIIHDAMKNSEMRRYYKFNQDLGTFENEGLELFVDHVLGGVNNTPKPIIEQASAGEANLRDFIFVYNNSAEDFKRMIDERLPPSVVKGEVKSKQAAGGMLHSFKKIADELKKIKIEEAAEGVPAAVQGVIAALEKIITAIKKHY